MSIRFKNSCFIHIPRTGGLWFGEVVERLGIPHFKFKGDIDSHMSFQGIRYLLEGNNDLGPWQGIKTFSFVRHPWSWVKSRWSHTLENNTYEDYRYYGIHRRFDECVRPTFKTTIETILEKCPGLVSKTFDIMTLGLDYIGRLEDFPEQIVYVLKRFENLEEERTWQIVNEVPRFNQSTGLDKYKDQYNVPYYLYDQFMVSEQQALNIWLGAANNVDTQSQL